MNIVDNLLKVALLGSAWVLYLLIVLSVFSISVILDRVVFFRRNRVGGAALRESLLATLRSGDEAKVDALFQSNRSVQARVVASAWSFRDGGAEGMENALQSEMAIARRELEKGSNFLGTIGNNGPFIGLLGTVIGVINAFKELGSDAARSGSMGNVMAGIAEALVATGVGLFVALPAVIAYNVIQEKIGEIENESMSLGRLLNAWSAVKASGGRVHEGAGVAKEPPARAVLPVAVTDGGE